MKHKPTDAEIDRLCAEVCNRCLHTERECISVEEDGDFDYYFRCKNCGAVANYEIRIPYTTDRNALPELRKAVEAAGYGKSNDFNHSLCSLLDIEATAEVGLWALEIASAPCRLHCIAALIALGKYPDDWEKE